MTTHRNRTGRSASVNALLVALASAALAGCSAGPAGVNRGLDSVHQPVVQRTNYTFDLASGPGGVAPAEARRLAGWFEAMDLRYGDRIAIDDPVASSATRASIEAVAARFGMLVSQGAPTTPGYVNPGSVRVIVSRSSASVPHCPDWHGKTDFNFNNSTSPGFGCAVNGNLAAMVANPEDLVNGVKGSSQTTIMSSDKAIDSYRAQTPTGEKGLSKTSSKGE